MSYQFPRCQIIPLPEHQVSFQIDGVERFRWHFGPQYPRPFFYPLLGPSGRSLTRMGHPGAQNHDHHRSVWFAHQKVLGIDFWSDQTDARIRQKRWLCYEDGDDKAVMAFSLGWYDGHDPNELLEQLFVAVLYPGSEGQYLLDLQSTFVPKAETLEFGKTNFGFLAVRVAKNISEHFGGGKLTNSDGRIHERNIFGKQARWIDYSGPVPSGKTEGITYFDHPNNPRYPNHWHVRADGWMGCSICMQEPIQTTRDNPLVLRQLLHVHAGVVDSNRAQEVARKFATMPRFKAVNRKVKHRQFVIETA